MEHAKMYVANFFIIKPTRCTSFQNLLWHGTLHDSGSSSTPCQSLFNPEISYSLSEWKEEASLWGYNISALRANM